MPNASSASSSLTPAPLTQFTADANYTWRFAYGLFQKSIAIIAFLLLWELAPRLGFINPSFLPPFSEIIIHGYNFAAEGKLLPHVVASLGRALSGFALGVATAVPVGILLSWYEPFERYFNPLLQLLRQFNSISLLPLFVMFFGVGSVTRIMIVYWVVVWPILLSTVSGIKYVDPILVKYGRSLPLSDWRIFTRIVAPSAIPSVVAGLRLAATYSFLVLVVSEQVGASSGLGYLVENGQYVMGIDILYVAVLMLALLGLAANFSLVLLESRLTRWMPNSRDGSRLGAKS